MGYYRKFIPNFALKAKPIYKLVSPKTEFQHLKLALCNQVELFLPGINSEFIITTDGCRSGLAAILSQERDGVRYPIWFASRSLKPAESNYSVSEIELLGVLFGVEKFRHYIELTKFTIETDHSALQWLQRIKNPAGRLARWFMTLQTYDFTVRHKSGSSAVIQAADALSRVTEDKNGVVADGADNASEETLYMMASSETKVLNRDVIISEQKHDALLANIIRYLKKEPLEQGAVEERIAIHAKEAYLSSDDLLWRFVSSKDKLWEDEESFFKVWLPQTLVKTVISLFHDDKLACHAGRNKTYKRIEQRVFWHGMSRDVANYIKACKKCAFAKPSLSPPAPLTSYVADSPWDVISVGLAGPYCKGANQSTALLIALGSDGRRKGYVNLLTGA